MSEFRESDETIELLARAKEGGDAETLDELFSRHRLRLRRMIQLRISRELKGRINASDVIQDAFLEASQRLAEYLRRPTMPFFLWLRFLTSQRLLALHRHHVGTKARDPRREISLFAGPYPEATTEALAAQLLGNLTSPSESIMRTEMRIRLQEALNALESLDRQVLALRHFEHLSNAEAAQELGIKESAASKRYIRALTKLKGVLTQLNMDPNQSGCE